MNLSKMIDTAVAIANDNSHGYSQPRRDGHPDFDCSSLTAHCLRAGGCDVNAGSTTRNLYSQLTKRGWKKVSGKCKAGDIYLTPGKHVVIAVTDFKVVTASGDFDGKKGDSSGREIRVRDFYIPSYGWLYHLRYTGANDSSGASGFTIGKDYTVQVNGLRVRSYAPNGEVLKKYSAGTVVTCKQLADVNGVTWMRTPSGWICTYAKGKPYVL